MTEELIFEKDYELLQEVKYFYQGTLRSTKLVTLKAPTFKDGEKLELALNRINPVTEVIRFICDAALVVSKADGERIPLSAFEALHVKAYRALANDYCKFFLTSELVETESK